MRGYIRMNLVCADARRSHGEAQEQLNVVKTRIVAFLGFKSVIPDLNEDGYPRCIDPVSSLSLQRPRSSVSTSPLDVYSIHYFC